MVIRIRTVIVIFFTTLLIISFSVFVGIFIVKSGVEKSQESDLMLLSDIAGQFISSEIKSLKLKAAETANLLSVIESTQWQEKLINFNDRHSEFTGTAVLDTNGELLVSTGETPANHGALENEHVRQAFDGKTALSSTVPSSSGGLVFYLASPIPEKSVPNGKIEKILVLTLPITYFSQVVSDIVIWETGHIFIDDSEGHIIANIRPEWVEDRMNYMHLAETDPSYAVRGDIVRRGINGESGIGHFSVSDVPRICAFRPISGSEEGWFLGVIAPEHESPFKNAETGLIVVGGVSLFLSLIAAVIASGFIKKPFEEIIVLKEEAEANSRFKSDFLANMSHEIRTPMNAILGITEILLQNETTPKNITENLNKIYSSGDLLLNIINDILDFSKIEAGKLELFSDNYETASLINDTVTLNMMRILSKDIEFKLSVDENIPNVMFGDEVRIRQILNNLLSNAVKYTEKGEIKLSFIIEKNNGENENNTNNLTLIIVVSDTGQGMTKEQVESLFDQSSRFIRYNYQANRTIEGTGLGINITQNLIKLMNGEIYAESELGKGSVFTVKLPQINAGTSVLGREFAEQLQNFNLNGTKHIKKSNIIYELMPYGKVLIVDDVETNLDVAKGLLMPYELSVETVTSGYAAIKKIKEGKEYDIVFMDHMMPQMDGIEATKIIRGLGYSHPIVALTANTVKGRQEEFMASGFDDFVSKPIDTRHLNTVLKKFIRDKQPPEVLEKVKIKETKQPKQKGIPDIPGLDVNRGLKRFDFNEDIFAKVLLSYAKSTRDLLEKLKKTDMENLSEYIVTVHGIKGSSYGITADNVGKTAESLEAAGNAGDYEFINANTEKLIDSVLQLIYDIEKALEKIPELSKPEKETPDAELLVKLLEACSGFDIDEIDAVMDEIEKYEYTSDDGLTVWLRENITQGKYGQIIEKLSE